MKRAVKVLFIAVYFAVLIYTFVCLALSGHVDFGHMNIYFGEVPEGTAFADILVKGKAEDTEMDFNVYNGSVLEVDRSCEIAEYNADGYTSLFLKHRGVDLEMRDLSPDSENKYMEVGGGSHTLSRFRYIKLAYCDKDGNILAITKKTEVKKTPLNDFTYEIKADGDELSCKVFNGPRYYLFALVLWAVVLFALCAAVIIIKEKIAERQSAKMRIPIQSGEADNESKKQD
jgi:hypothetical protein